MITRDPSSDGQRLCFSVTSHDPLAYDLRDSVLEPAIHAAGLLVLRSDDIEHGDRLASTIWAAIERCAAMVALVTAQSPHVYYELGIAGGLRVPTLVLVRETLEMPINTEELTVLPFAAAGPDLNTVAARLREMTSGKAVA
ncbi:hypothetical protein [Nisaea sp.]|uniref:hypothetical protein n=1 Tax=Nisaea sp. TaxID=2024842 RepID=UPI003B51B219